MKGLPGTIRPRSFLSPREPEGRTFSDTSSVSSNKEDPNGTKNVKWSSDFKKQHTPYVYYGRKPVNLKRKKRKQNKSFVSTSAKELLSSLTLQGAIQQNEGNNKKENTPLTSTKELLSCFSLPGAMDDDGFEMTKESSYSKKPDPSGIEKVEDHSDSPDDDSISSDTEVIDWNGSSSGSLHLSNSKRDNDWGESSSSLSFFGMVSDAIEEKRPRQRRRSYNRYILVLCLLMAIVGISLLAAGSLTVRGDKKSKTNQDVLSHIQNDAKFQLQDSYYLDDIEANVVMVRHIKTGMKVMAMIPIDITQDATFGMNIPIYNQKNHSANDHGTPYVVQRSIQYHGSQKYPINDPNNQLLYGSLQTYIDSKTTRDRTTFALSSRNLLDFRNLLKVNLNQIFKPLFTHGQDNKWIFRKEGWRIDTNEDNSDVQLNGNALTEARGEERMNPEQAMTNTMYRSLFPDTPYRFNPHGNAKDIVKLSYKETIGFHKIYYRPSNGQGFCFGAPDFVEECLSQIDNTMQHVNIEDEQVASEETAGDGLDWQKLNIQSPIKVSIPYYDYVVTDVEKEGPSGDNFQVADAWLLNEEPMDDRTEVAWFLIEELLRLMMDREINEVGEMSQNEKTYLESQNVTSLEGDSRMFGRLESSMQQWTMLLGFSGIPNQSLVEKAQDLINIMLQSIVDNGFSENDLQVAINKVEYRLREQSSQMQGVPRGVDIFSRVTSKWTYGQDPRKVFGYLKVFRDLTVEILDPDRAHSHLHGVRGVDFLAELITKCLIDNTHKVSMELFPVGASDVVTYQQQEDKDFFDRLESDMSQKQSRNILRESIHVQEHLNTPDSPETLSNIPRLRVKDLQRINEPSSSFTKKVVPNIFNSGITVLENLSTNNKDGIAYVDFAVDVSKIDFDDIVLLPLICRMMCEAGTDRQTAGQFFHEINAYTGGISISPLIEDIVSKSSGDTDEDGFVVPDGHHMATKIVLRGSVVAEKAVPLFKIFGAAVFNANMQNQKVAVQALKSMIRELEKDVQVNADVYMTYRIQSRYSLPGFMKEQLQGITQLMNLRRALYQAQTDWNTLATRLEAMHKNIVDGSRQGMLLSVTGDEEDIHTNIYPSIHVFVQDFLPIPNHYTDFQDYSKVQHPWVTKGMNRMKEEIQSKHSNEVFINPTNSLNHVGKGGVLFDIGERIFGSDVVIAQYISGFYLNKLKRIGGAEAAYATLDLDSGALIYQTANDPNIVATLDFYEEGASFVLEQVRTTDEAFLDDNELPVEANAAIVGSIGKLDGTAPQSKHIGYECMVQHLRRETAAIRESWRDEILGTQPMHFESMMYRLGAWGRLSISVMTNPRDYQQANDDGLQLAKCDYTGYTC